MNCNGHDKPSPSIHVLVADLTGVLSEMIERTVQQQSDMRLLEQGTEWAESQVLPAKPDVLVLGAETVYPPTAKCLRMLREHPDLKILILTPRSEQAIVYWRGIRQQQVQVASTQALLDSIRQVYELSLL